MTSENETKSIFFRTFFENVDFAKIVLSPRRRAHFQGLEPPKTDQKTSQNRCKDAVEKNAENPRPIWCHWVVCISFIYRSRKQQNDPKLLQLNLHCNANKTIVDGIDGRTLVCISYRMISDLDSGASGPLGLLSRSWARFGALLGAVDRSFGVPRVFCVRPWAI